MTNYREILRLFHQGISQRSIASSVYAELKGPKANGIA